MGVYALDQEAKRVLLSILRQNEEFIKNQTGCLFSISENNRSPDCIWIESQVFYDKSKPLQEQADMFAQKFIKVIKTFKELVAKFKGNQTAAIYPER